MPTLESKMANTNRQKLKAIMVIRISIVCVLIFILIFSFFGGGLRGMLVGLLMFLIYGGGEFLRATSVEKKNLSSQIRKAVANENCKYYQRSDDV